MDPFLASFLASVAHGALAGGIRRFLPGTYRQETESAIERTVESYDGVSRQVLVDVLQQREVESSVQDFVESGQIIPRSLLTERLQAQLEARESPPDVDPEEVVDELLANLQRELVRNHPEVHRTLVHEFRQEQLEHNDEVKTLLQEVLERIERTGSSQRGRPRVEVDATTTVHRDETYLIHDFDELETTRRPQRFKLPVAHTVSVTNVGDRAIENCRVWLDFFQRDLDPVLLHRVDGELLHLQTRLPWHHPISGTAVTLAPGDSVPVQVLAETMGEVAFVFPGIDGLPDLAPADLYGSRDASARFPSSWWFLAQRNYGYRFYHEDVDVFALLRITGSNVDPTYVTLDFDWDGWAGTGNSLPVSLETVHEPAREAPFPIAIDALADDIGVILRSAGSHHDCGDVGDSGIAVVGNPDAPLPTAVSFAAAIPTAGEATKLSLALGEDDGLSFTYNDFLQAVVARRIANRTSLASIEFEEAMENLRRNRSDLGAGDLPGTESDASIDGQTDVRLSNSALADLEQIEGRRLPDRLEALSELRQLNRRATDIHGVPVYEFEEVSSGILDQPLYHVEDEGIVFWTHPTESTPQIGHSVGCVTVEAVLNINDWRDVEHMIAVDVPDDFDTDEFTN